MTPRPPIRPDSDARRRWLAGWLSACAWLGALAWPGAGPSEDEAIQRLRAMPLERREELIKALRAFDRLDTEDQRALREMVAYLEGRDPAERLRLLDLAHRFALQATGWPEDQRRRIDQAATVGEWRALAADNLQKTAPTAPAKRGGLAERKAEESFRRAAAFAGFSPITTATLLQVWSTLPDQRKAQLNRKSPMDVQEELSDLARKAQIKSQVPDLDSLKLPLAVQRKMEKLVGEGAKKAGIPEGRRRWLEARLVEMYLLTRSNPEPVRTDRLQRFLAGLPAWAKSSMDDLDPQAAREVLIALYRQMYPAPAELPDAVAKPKADPTKDKDAPVHPKAKPAEPSKTIF